MAEKIVFEGTVASKVTERLREDIISKKIEAGSRITIKEILRALRHEQYARARGFQNA